MLIIDCHAHIYSPDENRYPTVDQPLRVPGGKASIEDLRHSMVMTIAIFVTPRKPILTGFPESVHSTRMIRTVPD